MGICSEIADIGVSTILVTVVRRKRAATVAADVTNANIRRLMESIPARTHIRNQRQHRFGTAPIVRSRGVRAQMVVVAEPRGWQLRPTRQGAIARRAFMQSRSYVDCGKQDVRLGRGHAADSGVDCGYPTDGVIARPGRHPRYWTSRVEVVRVENGDIVKCCGSPRELGGALLHLSRSAFRFLLHAIDEAHAGTHERQQLRAIHLSPALFGHREQLERHHQRLRA